MSDRYEIRETTIFDTHTGLEWDREVNGPMPWQAAMDAAASRGDGWRLPTIEELFTLINFSQYDPASEFPSQPNAWFWSSSSYALNASYAWVVDFNYGCARCVRGGKDARAEARARNDELSRELERVRDDLASHEAWARLPCASGETPCEKDVELVKLRGFLAGARADVHNLRREVCMEYVADDDAWNEVIDMKDPAVILDWFGSARNYAASRYGEEVADGLFDEDLRKWKEREKAPEANSEERQEEGRGDV